MAGLLPERSLRLLGRDGGRLEGALRAIEIEDVLPGARGRIELDTVDRGKFVIEGHLEAIPYGFDRPSRYELIIDSPVDDMELLQVTEDFPDESAPKPAVQA